MIELESYGIDTNLFGSGMPTACPLHARTYDFLPMLPPSTSIARYIGVLLGGCTILSGIPNSSTRVDFIKNQYCWVHKVTDKCAHHFVWHS